jgi:hypothetical protein
MSGEDAPRPCLENLIVLEIKTNKQTGGSLKTNPLLPLVVTVHVLAVCSCSTHSRQPLLCDPLLNLLFATPLWLTSPPFEPLMNSARQSRVACLSHLNLCLEGHPSNPMQPSTALEPLDCVTAM